MLPGDGEEKSPVSHICATQHRPCFRYLSKEADDSSGQYLALPFTHEVLVDHPGIRLTLVVRSSHLVSALEASGPLRVASIGSLNLLVCDKLRPFGHNATLRYCVLIENDENMTTP